MRNHRISLALWLSLSLACAVDAATPDDAEAERTAELEDSEGEAPEAEAGAAAATKPARAMPKARAAFDEVAALVGTRYVDGAIDDDALWTAAAEGVLARLVQSSAHPVNELMSPEELAELDAGVKGRLSGIGVVIEKSGDMLVVREALANGPGARAGLQGGDRILGVDGERIDPDDIAGVVAKIRGEKGTKVELFVQRDTEEWTVPVTRDDVAIPSVESRAIESVGYLRIGSLGKGSAAELDDALAQLRRERVAALVVDLRNCPGGWFEAATEVAERFVPAGTELVRVRDRDGKDEPIAARAGGAAVGMPLVVLVGPDTASGGEIIASALREHAGASIVGAPTVGKTTIESIHKLSNGWALKLSEKRFVLADGSSGVVRPDVPLELAAGSRLPAVAALDPASDAPLATGLQLLRGIK